MQFNIGTGIFLSTVSNLRVVDLKFCNSKTLTRNTVISAKSKCTE